MLKKMKHKLLSLAMTAAMITTLFAGLTISASAVTNYTATGTMSSLKTTTGFNTAATNGVYSISNATELGYLRDYVNGGYATSGRTFYLTKNITLSGSWTPIGGACAEGSGYIPNGKYFAGKFDGCNKTISGLSINSTVTTGSSSNFAGWGLFGCSSGVIANVKVTGDITLSGSAEYVGGVVGYTTGSVYNCHTEVTIDASGASNVGGVVGAIETTSASSLGDYALKIQYCSAKNNITAGKRIGGISGGAYCAVTGNIKIDNCSYISGTIYAKGTSSKVWSGGLLGYCKGEVSNSYTYDIKLQASGGHYVCGFAGLLNGYGGVYASATNCYSYVSSYTGCASNYDRPFVGSVDNSANVHLINCHWVNNGSYTQPTSSGWGTWEGGTGAVTSTVLTTSDFAETMGNAFVLGTVGYVILVWENTTYTTPGWYYVDPANGTSNTATPSSVTEDSSTGVFLNGTASTNGSGTKTSPYNSLSSALSAAGISKTIYILGEVTLSGNDLNLSSGSYNGASIMRSCTYNGYLFNVPSGNVTISGVTIDGNDTNNPYSSGSLVNVTGGALTIGTGAKLQKNIANSGGAVRVTSGSATMNNGEITDNTAISPGGGVALIGGNFTMSGGTISGNSATRGSGVYVSANKTFEYAGSGIASGQVVYLANTSGNSDAYITLTGTLGSITVVMANPYSGAILATGSGYNVSSNDAGNITSTQGTPTYINGTNNICLVING